MEEFKEKLRKLKELRKQASHASFKEALEENEKARRPINWERKLERDRKKIEAEEERQKIEELGQDYELKRSLDIQADEFEKWERIKAKKKRPDPGFIDYEAATKRQYERLTKQLKPDVSENKSTTKQRLDGVPTSSNTSDCVDTEKSSKKSLIKDSKEGIERMVEDVHKQIEVRSKRSRRRRFNDDADVDYINERNMRFNKKLERFYCDYTQEIKQNFERGTAM